MECSESRRKEASGPRAEDRGKDDRNEDKAIVRGRIMRDLTGHG